MNKQRANSVLRKTVGVLSSVVIVALVVLATHVKADDIEIFSNPNLAGIAPNVLFIFDFSDSMNKTPDGGTPSDGDPSKINILRDTVAKVLSREFSDLNVGVSWFTDRATGIRWPVSGINDDAHGIDSDIHR